MLDEDVLRFEVAVNDALLMCMLHAMADVLEQLNAFSQAETLLVAATLDKYDLVNGGLIATHNLDHTYYSIICSSDGSELYIGSTFSDIAVHDPKTLKKLGDIQLPGGGDQGVATFRVVQR